MTGLIVTIACVAGFAALVITITAKAEKQPTPTATEIDADTYWNNWTHAGGYYSEWDALDDRTEDQLDRQIRDGLRDWRVEGDVA
jgi:hypothetical protein